MRIKEQYKHLLNYSANFISLAVEGAAFAFIWYNVYEDSYGFFRRGNWAVVGLYVLIIFFFTKVLGGYNIGYMRIADIALSHVLSILLSGVIGYLYQRAAGWCECGSIEFTEWPCEGGLKPKDSGVGVDGSPVRYQRGAYDSM